MWRTKLIEQIKQTKQIWPIWQLVKMSKSLMPRYRPSKPNSWKTSLIKWINKICKIKINKRYKMRILDEAKLKSKRTLTISNKKAKSNCKTFKIKCLKMLTIKANQNKMLNKATRKLKATWRVMRMSISSQGCNSQCSRCSSNSFMEPNKLKGSHQPLLLHFRVLWKLTKSHQFQAMWTRTD